MPGYDGIGVEFRETMIGWMGCGARDYTEGRALGEREGTELRFDVRVSVPSLQRFLNLTDHRSYLEGTVSFGPLGEHLPITGGTLAIFTIDARTGQRRLIYTFGFTGKDGNRYYLSGYKIVQDDTGFDVVRDLTTLNTTLYRGTDETGTVFAVGQLFFRLTDAPAFALSLKVTGASWWGQEFAAKAAFLSFTYGILREEYLTTLNPLYTTSYQNLVLSGKAHAPDQSVADVFLVCGAHDRGFPWGDGEVFSDLLLVVRDAAGNTERYCISDRSLPGLSLDVTTGTCRYTGPLFRINEGYSTSFSALRSGQGPITACHATVDLSFKAHAYVTTPMPFRIFGDLLDQLSYSVSRILRKWLPSEPLLGIHITPHLVDQVSGTMEITGDRGQSRYVLDTGLTSGEAEDSTFRNVREPTMLYGYICGVHPDRKTARIQIQANSMRNDRQYWGKDRIDAYLGAVISHLVATDLNLEPGTNKPVVTDLTPAGSSPASGTPRFVKLGDPLLEVHNDHFPTAIFQRRIIEVKDPDGRNCLALEEAMDQLRRESIDSNRTAIVASIRDDDPLRALETVLNATGFWGILDEALGKSGKTKDRFAIVIKPNFMFAYNWRDRTTYTDPALVGKLAEWLHGAGYTNITVVEAQSTYGEYFTNRRVREVAEYLKYDVSDASPYRLVDLTEDDKDHQHFGSHLGYHPVARTWKHADFRISFAKNKTHAYAYYTLTLKNVYGALPLGDKFKEYHCARDIYATTIEFLQAYPVHFGIVDAYVGADGPFGIFADSEPNETHTILGGQDLVAVDWVGATKMGLDPKISRYMELAVKAFGKPAIELIGDAGPYMPWLNVPLALTLFTRYGLDSNHTFGNILYMAGAYMDEEQFKHKSRDAFMKAARQALKPIQKMVFLQSGGERTVANRIFGAFQKWLGS